VVGGLPTAEQAVCCCTKQLHNHACREPASPNAHHCIGRPIRVCLALKELIEGRTHARPRPLWCRRHTGAWINCEFTTTNNMSHSGITSSKDPPKGELLKRAATWWAGPALRLRIEIAHGCSSCSFHTKIATHLSQCVQQGGRTFCSRLTNYSRRYENYSKCCLPAHAEPQAHLRGSLCLLPSVSWPCSAAGSRVLGRGDSVLPGM
jgi:hypothetical protein